MNVQTTSFAGSNLTLGQATQAALNYDQTRIQEDTEPYNGVLKLLNDDFISHLDRFDDDPKLTLGELKADLDAFAASQRKKAKIATWAGIGMAAAGFVGPRLGVIPGSLSWPLLIGGLFALNWVGGGARAKAGDAELFGQQLADWGRALSAQGVQPPAQQPPAPPAQNPPQGQAA
ncbi:MAG: hypothetical protein HY319_21465 [Armatimonadetes bacterium]|nr:hypothetical protein [Armatimonadota bacterium]